MEIDVNQVIQEEIQRLNELFEKASKISKTEFYPFSIEDYTYLEESKSYFGSFELPTFLAYGIFKDVEHSPWTCRFVSVDPLAAKYVHLAPYAYADNKPINFVDIDGAETASTNETPPGGNKSSGTTTYGHVPLGRYLQATKHPTGGSAEGIPEGAKTLEHNPQSDGNAEVSTLPATIENSGGDMMALIDSPVDPKYAPIPKDPNGTTHQVDRYIENFFDEAGGDQWKEQNTVKETTIDIFGYYVKDSGGHLKWEENKITTEMSAKINYKGEITEMNTSETVTKTLFEVTGGNDVNYKGDIISSSTSSTTNSSKYDQRQEYGSKEFRGTLNFSSQYIKDHITVWGYGKFNSINMIDFNAYMGKGMADFMAEPSWTLTSANVGLTVWSLNSAERLLIKEDHVKTFSGKNTTESHYNINMNRLMYNDSKPNNPKK